MSLARVAIIGGGPGGLTLARLLKVQHIPFRLFEQEDSRVSRSQGGTLDIHKESGQMALKAAGIFTEFQKYARSEGAAVKVLDKNGKVVWADDGLNPEGGDLLPDRPEIDRQDLRKILLDSLDEGQVEWREKVVNILEDDASTKDKPQFTVELDSGKREGGFELVVGADGAWSRVRRLLTKVEPSYSGVTWAEDRLDNVDIKHPDLAERVGLGTCIHANGPVLLVAQRNSDGSIRTYGMLQVEEGWAATCGINWADTQASKQALIDSKYADWDALCNGLILRSGEPLIFRPLYMLPVEMQWGTRPGVTLIGDAAHLMTPYAGQGANLALVDALDLSEAIRSSVHDKVGWETTLRQFEAKMFARSHVAARNTFANMKTFFADDNTEGIAGIFKKFNAGVGSKENN